MRNHRRNPRSDERSFRNESTGNPADGRRAGGVRAPGGIDGNRGRANRSGGGACGVRPPRRPERVRPPGWPLEIGDRITTKEYFTLDAGLDEGPKVPFRGGEYYSALGLIALHMVGDRVYSADFNSPDWTYYGHFPAEKYVGPKRHRDHELPPQFRNRIDYPEPYSGPLRMGTFGPHTTPPHIAAMVARVRARWDSIDAGLFEMPDNQWYWTIDRLHWTPSDRDGEVGLRLAALIVNHDVATCYVSSCRVPYHLKYANLSRMSPDGMGWRRTKS